jgi:hypothetical protein
MQSQGSIASLSGLWQVHQVASGGPRSFRQSSPVMYLRDWLLLIPDFDGCAHSLERFADAVRYVGAQLGPGWERILLLALGCKLRDRARELFGHRLHRHGSPEELLQSLRTSFGDLGGEELLLEELQRARQEVGESVGEYGARLDKLATRLCLVYEDDRLSGEELREANKSLVWGVALASFRRGLRSLEVEVRVGASEPKTLEEAVNVAIVLENGIRRRPSTYYKSNASCRRGGTSILRTVSN